MNFKDLKLDIHYDSGKSDLLNEFYIPVLSNASEYYRAVGFFNSRSLSLVASGLKNFILNKGKMKLICGADLSPQDVKSIMIAEKTPEEIITKNFTDNLNNLENYIEKHHIQVLGWMVANNLLDIKIAIKLDDFGNPLPNYDGIFHYKVGILKDFDGNYIAFSGSNNESGAAWSKNFEHFDVFRSWNKYEYNHLSKHIELFNNTIHECYDEYSILSIPEAVEKELVKCAPQDFNQLKFHDDIDNDIESEIILFDYQIEARDNWIENGRKGIFSMATGTGKTYTALGCLKDTLISEKKLITVISVPYQHLVQQWKKSLEKFGITKLIDKLIIADGTNSKKYQQIEELLLDIDLDNLNNGVIIAVHNTFSNNKFINLFKQDIKAKFFLIGDEMHGLGSNTLRRGLLEERYDYRLGLSATPQRFFDDYGTELLFEFFGDEVFGFSLKKALETINPMTDLTYLTPYNYHVSSLELTSDELEEYEKLSFIIAIESNKKQPNKSKIEKKLIERANLIKNAKNKYSILREVLSSMDDKKNLLIFCSERQIEKVLDILGNEFNMKVRTFTSANKSNPIKSKGNKSERDIILEDFESGAYDGIVSMHCLDEGVDIPSASKAILMCNSTNPREFIQRVGRVIRRNENKSFADIYDMVIKPSKFSDFKETEYKIFKKEKERTDMIGECAINSAEYHIKVYE